MIARWRVCMLKPDFSLRYENRKKTLWAQGNIFYTKHTFVSMPNKDKLYIGENKIPLIHSVLLINCVQNGLQRCFIKIENRLFDLPKAFDIQA